MPISKLLIHWTGKDKIEEKRKKGFSEDWLVNEYADRLKDYYRRGLFARRKKEVEVLPGVSINNLVRICFSEIRLSQAKDHAARYGALGIGFSRDFIASKGGQRVIYIPYEPEGGLVERDIKSAWKESRGIPTVQASLKWMLAFCKPMSNGQPEDSADYVDNYEEMEWRLVYRENSDPGGVFSNPQRFIHRVEFNAENVKLIVFPDDKVRRRTLEDAEMAPFFNAHQPDLVLLEDCIHF